MAIPTPDCFIGLSPDDRMLAIFEVVLQGGGGGNLNLYEQPDGFFYNQPDGDSFYLIP